jgi:hypothetical protein
VYNLHVHLEFTMVQLEVLHWIYWNIAKCINLDAIIRPVLQGTQQNVQLKKGHIVPFLVVFVGVFGETNFSQNRSKIN